MVGAASYASISAQEAVHAHAIVGTLQVVRRVPRLTIVESTTVAALRFVCLTGLAATHARATRDTLSALTDSLAC